jgi:hypothetical protein
MSRKSSKEPEVTPEIKDNVYSFSEIISKLEKKFKQEHRKWFKKGYVKGLKRSAKVGNAAMDVASSKTPLPEKAALHIIFNSTQAYKDDYDGTYKQLELSALAKSAHTTLSHAINVVSTFHTETRINMFKEFGKMIVENVQANRSQFCSIIDNKFIMDSLKTCNALVMLDNGVNDVIGFATLFFLLDDNEVYIDVICTNQKYKGGGHKMISKIKEICEILDIKSIELSSLTEAVGFYIGKEDFECNNELCYLTYNVKKKSAKRKRSPKSPSRSPNGTRRQYSPRTPSRSPNGTRRRYSPRSPSRSPNGTRRI